MDTVQTPFRLLLLLLLALRRSGFMGSATDNLFFALLRSEHVLGPREDSAVPLPLSLLRSFRLKRWKAHGTQEKDFSLFCAVVKNPEGCPARRWAAGTGDRFCAFFFSYFPSGRTGAESGEKYALLFHDLWQRRFGGLFFPLVSPLPFRQPFPLAK